MTGPPAGSIAPERDVKLLMQKMQFPLTQIKEALKDVVEDPHCDDDLFLLRFLLSSDGDVGKAESNVRATLKWRREKAELLMAAKDGTPPPRYATFVKYVATAIHGTTNDGDVIYLIRAGLANTKALLFELSADEVVDYMMYRREQVYSICDETTRRTGRLCKSVTINDLNYAAVSKMHRQFTQALSTVSKLSEIYYPQFLDTAIMINLPTVMKAVMRTMWSFMPKKTQEKLRVCPGRTLHEDISKCPFVRARLAVESVPTFLGGGCHCQATGGCVEGTANDQKESNLETDADGLSKCSVASRSKYEAFLTVDAGSTVSYAFKIEKGTLSSGSITLEAVLRNDSKELTLLQAQKYKPEQDMVRGEFACPEAGTCVLSFSNGSPLWSRTIRYSAVAIGPQGQMAGVDGHREDGDQAVDE